MKKWGIGIIGVGVLGTAIKNYYDKNHQIFCYDNHKNVGSIEEVNRADIVFICVPTPRGTGNYCDTSIVNEAIGYIRDEKIIVIKSTIIPGTTDTLQRKYPQHKILFCPEFLTAKKASDDFKNPNLTIVGYTLWSQAVSNAVYGLMPRGQFGKIMPAMAAEIFKYFRNSFLAVKDAFANQIWELCQILEIDYENIKQCAEADIWIGPQHLDPWCDGYRGFNGKCLPKDTEAFLAWAAQMGSNMSVLEEAVKYNSRLLKSQNIKKES